MKGLLLLVNLAVVLLLAGLLVPPALAQDTGIIEGTVRDSSGAAIPAARDHYGNSNQYPLQRSTDAQGNYVSPPLRVGIYSVSVSATGFKTYGTPASCYRCRIGFAWTPRWRSEAHGAGAGDRRGRAVQTDTSSLGQVISHSKLVDMPLNGRNYLGLMTF